MALAQTTMARIVKIVSEDEVATYRIQSYIRHALLFRLPYLKTKVGFTRNMMMALGQGLLDYGGQYAEGRYGVNLGKGWNPLDPNAPGSMGFELQCTGIAEQAVAAIEKKRASLPAVKDLRVASRSSGFAHAGVLLETTDGGAYIADWWLSLDVNNPFLFRHKDWDNDVSGSGTAFADFGGFP